MPTTHTPGPWTFDESRNYYDTPVIRNNGLIIAAMCSDSTLKLKERDANARLIASAPALYAALQDCLDDLEAWRKGYPEAAASVPRGELDTVTVIHQARAALAAADGQVQP